MDFAQEIKNIKDELSTYKNKVGELSKKLESLSSPASLPSDLVEALVQKGFIKYDNKKVITYTNPSGKDFIAMFARYANETILINIEPTENYSLIESIDVSGNIITITNHGLSDTQMCYVATTNTAPGGLSTQTIYYVRDATADTFKLALTSGGTAINITSVGAGNNYIRPQ